MTHHLSALTHTPSQLIQDDEYDYSGYYQPELKPKKETVVIVKEKKEDYKPRLRK